MSGDNNQPLPQQLQGHNIFRLLELSPHLGRSREEWQEAMEITVTDMTNTRLHVLAVADYLGLRVGPNNPPAVAHDEFLRRQDQLRQWFAAAHDEDTESKEVDFLSEHRLSAPSDSSDNVEFLGGRTLMDPERQAFRACVRAMEREQQAAPARARATGAGRAGRRQDRAASNIISLSGSDSDIVITSENSVRRGGDTSRRATRRGRGGAGRGSNTNNTGA